MEENTPTSPVGGVIERAVSSRSLAADLPEVSGHIDLRPKGFVDYPGQEKAVANLLVYVKAAKIRERPMDHVLLHGPPGLGKTTLAHILANELGCQFQATSGPSIDRPGDLAGILTGLAPGSVLFIDEIHRLSIQVEEILYGAMEDFAIDILVGQGPTARTVKLPVPPFTLVGATTRVSSLSRPLLSRFGIQERLEFYSVEALEGIIQRSASLLGIQVEQEGARELACRSRGTPRIANRLLRRVSDFALVDGRDRLDVEIVGLALDAQQIDTFGLDGTDRLILSIIKDRYDGGPVGIDALAVSVGEERATLEEVYEPYLVHQGYIVRGARGRMLTTKGYKAIAIK